MFTQQFFVEGLGCASYLIGDENAHVAAVIDPDRDVQKYIDAASAHGLTITHIIETHLHADHVSGNTELATRTGAPILLHERAKAAFPYIPLRDGEFLELGAVRLNILHTPGHTPESITLLVTDTTRSTEPALAITGDTLFVGDVGRPDLVGEDSPRPMPGASAATRSVTAANAASQLASAMHDSLEQKILPLADGLIVYPGHGAGSLCGRALGTMRMSTLGYERHFNPALQPRTRDEFVEFDISDLPEQPPNHTRIKAMNRQGPPLLGEIQPRPLDAQTVISDLQRGAVLLDTRSKADFAARHIPGSVHLEANDQLANRVGVVLAPDVPIVLVLDDAPRYSQVVYMLARVGYDRVAGYLAVSMDEWAKQGLPVVSGDVREIDPHELDVLLQGDTPPLVLDVREPWEFRHGHVPDARLIPLGELQARYTELDPAQPVAVICQSGNRSQTAAVLLAQKGFRTVYNVREGTVGWQRRGLPVET